MKIKMLIVLFMRVLVSPLYSEESLTQEKTAPSVILKMDDLVPVTYALIPPSWQTLVEICEEFDIKATFGIIGKGLENPPKEFVDWVKALNETGRFQFWNHGYTHAQDPSEDGKPRGEFRGPDAATQRESIERTQVLAKEKLGIVLTAFGSPFNFIDENTDKALSEVPDIQEWFYGSANPKYFKGTVLPRYINLENPVHNPNLKSLMAGFEKQAKKVDVLVLQGHPGGWNEDKLKEFRKIVLFLKNQGCEFLTASEYAARKK